MRLWDVPRHMPFEQRIDRTRIERIRVNDPKLNILVAGPPMRVIDSLKSE